MRSASSICASASQYVLYSLSAFQGRGVSISYNSPNFIGSSWLVSRFPLRTLGFSPFRDGFAKNPEPRNKPRETFERFQSFRLCASRRTRLLGLNLESRPSGGAQLADLLARFASLT